MRGFAPRRATGPSPSSRARLAVVLLVACAAQILSVLLVGYPPIQDYPNHLLRRHVIEHHSQVSVYAEHLGIDKRFRPNMLMDLYLALLAQLLPLQLAGKALICTFIFLGYSAVWFYLRRFGEDLLGALIACHLAGSWIFLKGLLNFNAGISFGLIYLAVLWPVRNRFHWRRAALAHLISFAMVCARLRIVVLYSHSWPCAPH